MLVYVGIGGVGMVVVLLVWYWGVEVFVMVSCVKWDILWVMGFDDIYIFDL